MVKDIKSDDFENEVLKQDGIVLVDFFATWCPPCKLLSPLLDEISNSRADFKIVRVNVDENADKASQYSIEVVPTLVVFKNGKEVNRSEGYIPKEEVLDLVSVE